MRKTVYSGILASVLLVSINPAIASPLTEDMFVETHVGKCISYSGPTIGTQCYNADGTVSYEDETYGADNGTWAYRDGKICVKWSKEASENCQAYKQEEDGSFTDAAGYGWSLGN